MKRFVNGLTHFSIEHLWPLTVMVGIFAFANTQPVMPHDFWWHLAVGRDILTSGSIPIVDVYSYTRLGEVYASYQQFWLMDVVLYGVYRVLGLSGTILAQSLLVTLTYGLLLRLMQRQARNWRAAGLGLLFAAALGFGSWNIRPQTIAFLLAVLLLTAADDFRRRQDWRSLAAFPFIMLVWVNSHGSFPIGFALLGIWWLEDAFTAWRSAQDAAGLGLGLKLRRALWPPSLALGLSALAALLNPRGPGALNYLSGMAVNPAVQQYATEWMPSSLQTLDGALFLLGLLLLTLLWAYSPRRPRLSQALSLVVFGVLAMQYVRGVVWFGLFLAPAVADHAAALLERQRLPAHPPGAWRLNLLLAGMLLLLGLVSLPWFKQALPLAPEKRALLAPANPVAATEFLLSNPLPGNLFHEMGYGSYLIWAAQPDYPVFIDPRLELYPQEIWNDYFWISSGQANWAERLEKYDVKTLMLSLTEQPGLVQAARADAGWREVYADPATVIFTRQGR